MCGIAGFVTVRPSRANGKVLERMTEIIHHRGPDHNGFYRDDFASLGHRRLSIIDLSAGQQPMSNEDGTRWIIYNGEVFNHAGLRPELEQAGITTRPGATPKPSCTPTKSTVPGVSSGSAACLHSPSGTK